MNSGWQTVALGAACELITRGIAPAYINTGGLRILNQKCIRDHGIDYSHARRHDSAVKRVPPERLIRAGDVLVNSTGTGTLGRVAQVLENPNEPTTVDTHITILRAKNGLFDREFFGYAIIKIEKFLIAAGEGASGQTELPKVKLQNNFQIHFPTSKSEQQHIVTVLNEAIAGISEATAVSTKAFEKAISLAPAAIAYLMKNSTSTWDTLTVRELIDRGILARISDGNHGEIHPTKDEFVPQGVPFIMASDLRDGHADQTRCRFISEERAKSLRVGFARDGDVLLSHKGTIGRVALLRTDRPYVMLTPQVTYYRSRNERALLPRYLYHALRGQEFQEQLQEIANLGSTRAYIGITRQLDLKIAVPSIDEQQRLATTFDKVDREVKTLERSLSQKLSLLAELKQSILARAFSGELTREPVAA